MRIYFITENAPRPEINADFKNNKIVLFDCPRFSALPGSVSKEKKNDIMNLHDQ